MYFIDYDEGTENERNDEIGRLYLNRHVGRCRFRDPSGAKYGCCPAISSVFGRVNGETAVCKESETEMKGMMKLATASLIGMSGITASVAGVVQNLTDASK